MIQPTHFSIFQGIGKRLLLWFSLFFLIPLLTVSYTGYQQSKKAIQRQVYDHFESLLNLQREALVDLLHQKEVQLKSSVIENEFLFISTVVLQSTTFSKGDILAAREKMQKYVTEKNQELGSREIRILGKNGRVIASSDSDIIDHDYSLSPEFVDYQKAPFQIRSHSVQTHLGPEVLICAPIQSESDEFLGLVSMAINMEDLYRILENRIGLGDSGETYLVNAEGYMISRSRFFQNVILKKRVRLKEILEQKDWRYSETYRLNYSGRPVIQAHTEFPFFGWILIGEMETSEAFHDLTMQRNRTVLLALILFCLLVVTAAILSSTLTRPIRTLALAAKQVAEGNFNQRIETRAGDELGDLAYEFNRMTVSLKESKKRMEEWNATIQKEVEIRTEELMKSELKFRNLMEKANDAIMIFSTHNQLCTTANIKCEILTGFSPDELLHARFFDFFLSGDMERLKRHYEEALNKGSASLYNIPLQRKDGRLAFVDISNSLIDYQDQQFLSCILHDVTERRKVEREREAISQISDIIAKSSDLDLILKKSLDNILRNLELEVAVIFLYNPQAHELILSYQKGFSHAFVENFARQTVTEDTNRVCTKTAFTKEMQYLQNPFEGTMTTFLHPSVDRENLQSMVSLPLIAEERLVGVLQIVTSRTRRFSSEDFMLLEALANQLAAGVLRIQVEQEKHQDDQFLASVLTESLDAIISMDQEDRVTTWNRGAERIFHLQRKEVIGTPFASLFQDPAPLHEKEIRRNLRDKGFIKDYEIVSAIRDGEQVILQISQTAILDPYGRFTGSLAIIRDITEQKEMQERIQQSEKLSSVGQLAAGIAHEIGTPLNIISGNAEYLMMDRDPKEPQVEELSIIIHQTERITKLIQQLMDFARDTQPSLEPTDVEETIDNTLTLTRHQLKKLAISLDFKMNGTLPKIVADPHQLQQVFLNLIINAIQAMPHGGTLSIETSVALGKKGVQVRVRDTGYGIPREVLRNIFNPFFTTKDVGQGTGLGLAVSHRIIENHKGRIEVESKVNEGTCFTVLLPFHPEEA